MFKIVPFKKEHILPLLEQPKNIGMKSHFLNGLAEEFEASKGAFTGLYNGEVMVCGGIGAIWNGRGILWSVFGENAKGCFISVFRGIKSWLKDQPYNRIELSTPVDNLNAHRRARMLGFKMETPFAEHFLPNGDDCALFSLIKRKT